MTALTAGPSDRGTEIISLRALELTFTPRDWAFARERRKEIDAYFAELKRDKPEVWNGRVLVMHDYAIAAGCFRGAFLETDFASLRAWIAWGYPPAGAWDCFGAAAILSADNAWLLGVMGSHTANAGRIYFPSGTPDQQDVAQGRVDLGFSVRRELHEETGLTVDDFIEEPGWTMVRDGALVVHIKVLRARDDAETLRRRIQINLKDQRQPELSDVRIVRAPGDLDAAMPRFIELFLKHRWR
jgi:8-oxo-dGTP pyrophosphatase MutT (NUDIX family)